MKYIFLYNPLAGEGKAVKFAEKIKAEHTENLVYTDMTKIGNFGEFITALDREDKLIICGGDGTLNRFVNATDGVNIPNDIIYYPAGSGNDFMNDLGRTEEDGAFTVNEYISDLPSVTVKGNKYRFINGVGFGVDGYVCAEGNRLRSRGKRVNYTTIAVKGLLFAFKPVNATVVIDGKEYKYRKVWMTTSMKGRFFGGGMKITPDQDRNSPDGKISVLIAHSLGKLKIATLFPTIFEGKHIKYTDYIDIHRCHSISVKYDKPCDLQMDGETLSGITEYTATTVPTKEIRNSEINVSATHLLREAHIRFATSKNISSHLR